MTAFLKTDSGNFLVISSFGLNVYSWLWSYYSALQAQDVFHLLGFTIMELDGLFWELSFAVVLIFFFFSFFPFSPKVALQQLLLFPVTYWKKKKKEEVASGWEPLSYTLRVFQVIGFLSGWFICILFCRLVRRNDLIKNWSNVFLPSVFIVSKISRWQLMFLQSSDMSKSDVAKDCVSYWHLYKLPLAVWWDPRRLRISTLRREITVPFGH